MIRLRTIVLWTLWITIVIFILGITAINTHPDEVYLNPDLINIGKIRELEGLSENYQIKRLYIFLAIKQDTNYEAYVARDGMDPDEDKKTVIDEPNDLSEFEALMIFNRDITIEDNKHISYITDLPNFDKLFPDVTNPFEDGDIVELNTKQIDGNKTHMIGSVTIPVVDSITKLTTGLERYSAFYNRPMIKVPIVNDKEDKTVEVKFEEVISEVPDSFGFIYVVLEEIK